MFGANKKTEYQNNNLHLVLICDEAGIFDTFKVIKDCLTKRGETFLSLIYTIPNNILNPMFERELRILGKRYSHSLFIYKLKIESRDYELIQGFIEAIINSNTNPKMQFSVSGSGEFVSHVTRLLGYLNIDSCYIKSDIV